MTYGFYNLIVGHLSELNKNQLKFSLPTSPRSTGWCRLYWDLIFMAWNPHQYSYFYFDSLLGNSIHQASSRFMTTRPSSAFSSRQPSTIRRPEFWQPELPQQPRFLIIQRHTSVIRDPNKRPGRITCAAEDSKRRRKCVPALRRILETYHQNHVRIRLIRARGSRKQVPGRINRMESIRGHVRNFHPRTHRS